MQPLPHLMHKFIQPNITVLTQQIRWRGPQIYNCISYYKSHNIGWLSTKQNDFDDISSTKDVCHHNHPTVELPSELSNKSNPQKDATNSTVVVDTSSPSSDVNTTSLLSSPMTDASPSTPPKRVHQNITNITNPPALRGFTPQVPGQVLYPATEEDIKILSQSSQKYPLPLNVEGGVIVRLVRLSDAVTSPVGRSVRNRQFGIRNKTERWQLLLWGFACSSAIATLGVWQLQRMKWKSELVEYRRSQLSKPRSVLQLEEEGSAPPWVEEGMEEWSYRTVECYGVLDTPFTVRVGPRAAVSNGRSGYLLVSPLRLANGKTLLINRGHCLMENLDTVRQLDIPEWVRIRGVVTSGEQLNSLVKWKKLKNKPNDKLFISLDAADIGRVMGASNIEECKMCVINAYDIFYEEDVGLPIEEQRGRFKHFEMKQKEEYLIFWADEHTHFNYAMQWFLMSALTMVMTLYKYLEVVRWKF